MSKLGIYATVMTLLNYIIQLINSIDLNDEKIPKRF